MKSENRQNRKSSRYIRRLEITQATSNQQTVKFKLTRTTSNFFRMQSGPVKLQVDDVCKPGEDKYECIDSLFLSCSSESNRWVVQNRCSGQCSQDPSFSTFCFASSNTTGSETSQTTETSNQAAQLNNIQTILLSVLLPAGIVLVAAAIYMYFKWQKSQAKDERISAVFDKRYIVMTEFRPIENDEIYLRAGDEVVVDSYFNDGWAKGKNTASSQEGVFPLLCVQSISD
jgi:hypothetical protein